MLYLLDTDHFSLIERGTTEGTTIQARLSQFSSDDYGISIITYAEKTKGWLAQTNSVSKPEDEVRVFGKLQTSFRLCSAFAIWEYTPDAAKIRAELLRQRVRVGTQDVRIAAIALANNATLLTRDRRDFGKVPGLLFAGWTL